MPKPEALVFLPVPVFAMSILPLDAAFSINGPGAIAGRLGSNAAVYWRGAVTVLPGKAGYTNLLAVDIADNGFIAGSGLSAGQRRGLFWESTTAQPLDMGALGAITSPRAINSAGTVVGSFQATVNSSQQAFRWSRATGMVPIAPAVTDQSEAVDISETGFIAGVAHFVGLGQQVVRWLPNGAVGRVAGPALAFRAKNDGSILGLGNGATLWNPQNTAQPIGPAPFTHSVKQTSSTGRNVGVTVAVPFRAWTTVGKGTTPLVLPIPAGAISFASDVNSCGTILGSITLADGTQKSVVWTRIVCDDLPSER